VAARCTGEKNVGREHVMPSAELWVPEDYQNNIKNWFPNSQKTSVSVTEAAWLK
jgi:hypothetical protein